MGNTKSLLLMRDRDGLTRPYMEFGYYFRLLSLDMRDSKLLHHGLSPEVCLERMALALLEVKERAPGVGGGLVGGLAGEMEGARFEAYCSWFRFKGVDPHAGDRCTTREQYEDAVQRLGLVIAMQVRRYLALLPAMAWILVGSKCARIEYITSHTEADSASSSAEPDRDLVAAATSLTAELRRVGWSERETQHVLKTAGTVNRARSAEAKAPVAFGRLHETLTHAIRRRATPFWEERPDGTYWVAGVEVKYEWYLILGSIRHADRKGLRCDELIDRSGVASADKMIGEIREHPELGCYVEPKGLRLWSDFSVPLPPRSLLKRLTLPKSE